MDIGSSDEELQRKGDELTQMKKTLNEIKAKQI